MLAIRCPKCGAVNDERVPDFPRCRKCGYYLYRCGLCQYHQDGACTHPSVPPGVTVERDAVPVCGLFSAASRPQPSIPAFRSLLVTWRWPIVVALLSVLIYAGVRLLESRATAKPTVLSGLVVVGDCSSHIFGEEGALSLEVVNAGAQEIPLLTLRIPRESFQLLEIPAERITPPPTQAYTEPASGARYMIFGSMRPGGVLPIHIMLQPINEGDGVISLDVLSTPDQPLRESEAHLEYRVHTEP